MFSTILLHRYMLAQQLYCAQSHLEYATFVIQVFSPVVIQ